MLTIDILASGDMHSRLHLGTHNRNTIINIWTPRTIENLVWVWVCGAGGNVIGHHDHNVFLQDATLAQDLVRLQD